MRALVQEHAGQSPQLRLRLDGHTRCSWEKEEDEVTTAEVETADSQDGGWEHRELNTDDEEQELCPARVLVN